LEAGKINTIAAAELRCEKYFEFHLHIEFNWFKFAANVTAWIWLLSTQTAGIHQASFQAGMLSSGIYFSRLTALGVDGSSSRTINKLMLAR
jgi:hypothetical protein